MADDDNNSNPPPGDGIDINEMSAMLEGIMSKDDTNIGEELNNSMDLYWGKRAPFYKLLEKALKNVGGNPPNSPKNPVNNAIPKENPIDKENRLGMRRLFKTKFFDNVLKGLKGIIASAGSILMDFLEFFLFMAFVDPSGSLLKSLISIFLKIFVMIVKIVIKLIPTAIKLLFETAEFVFKAILKELPGLFNAVGDMLMDLGKKFPKILPFIQPLITLFKTLANIFTLFNSKNVAKKMDFKELAILVGMAFLNFLTDTLIILVKTLVKLFPIVIDLGRQLFVLVFTAISQIFSPKTFALISPMIKDFLTKGITLLFSAFNIGGDAGQLGKDIDKLMGFIKPFFILIGDIAGAISGFFVDIKSMSFKEAFSNLLKNLGKSIGVAIGSLIGFLFHYVTSGEYYKDVARLLDFLVDAISMIGGFLKEFLFSMIDGIFGVDSGIGAFLKVIVGGIIDFLVFIINIPLQLFSFMYKLLGDTLEFFFVTIPAFFGKFTKWFFKIFDLSKWVNLMRAKVDGFIEAIKAVFARINFSNLFSLEGLTSGFTGFSTWLAERVKSAFSHIGVWFGEMVENLSAVGNASRALGNQTNAGASAKMIYENEGVADSLAVAMKKKLGEDIFGGLIRNNAEAMQKAMQITGYSSQDITKIIDSLKDAQRNSGQANTAIEAGMSKIADALNGIERSQINPVALLTPVGTSR